MKSNSYKMIIGGIEWERSIAHITTEAWFVKIEGVKWTMKKKYKMFFLWNWPIQETKQSIMEIKHLTVTCFLNAISLA